MAFFRVRQSGQRPAFDLWQKKNEKSFICSSLFLYHYIKQIDSMLPCVCSVIDHRRRQNVVRTSVTHSAIASCATFLFLPHFDVICDLLLNRRTATWNLFVKQIHGWRHEKLIFLALFNMAHGFENVCTWDNILGLSKWKPCKKVSRSYWHRKKKGATETKTVLDDLRIPKLQEIFMSSKRETRWFAKCFRHYSALSKWRRWKTFRRNSIKVR